jgi:putative ABC transport system permease protein
MTHATLIWHNFWRNRTRTLLTVTSLGFSLFLLTLLGATVDCIRGVAESSAEHLRLVVHHKTTVTKLLPLGHGPKIAAMSGVRAVCGMRWFGGRLEQSQEQFPSMAVDPVSFPAVFADFALSANALAAWNERRTAAIVGIGLAKRIGCEVGDRVVLTASVPPYLRLEFQVVGITQAGAYPNVFVFRLDYLIDALRADPMMPPEHDDAVNIYWLCAISPDVLDSVRGGIDEAFANSPDATMTEFEEAFVVHFTKMFGDIPALIRNVGWIVTASILLVLCNALSTGVRERIGEWAIFKAIGYTTRRLIFLLLGEAALMGLIGGVGCLLAFCSFGFSAAAGLSMPYFPIITVSPLVAVGGVGISVLVNLAAALIPARTVSRLCVTAVLRDTG